MRIPIIEYLFICYRIIFWKQIIFVWYKTLKLIPEEYEIENILTPSKRISSFPLTYFNISQSRLPGKNINNLRYANDTSLMAESEELSLLMKGEKESEKVGLKLNIQKTKIMASGLITSWQVDGETMETVTDFILGVSKITADGDCTHEVKDAWSFEEKYDQQHIKKQRHYFANRSV